MCGNRGFVELSLTSTQFYYEPITVLKNSLLKNPWASNGKMGHRKSRDSSHAKVKIALKDKKRHLILFIDVL